MKRLQLKIHGRVQGVFFRESSRKRAEELGLVGWIENAADRTVDIVAEGDEGALKKLLDWCTIGPPGARVESIDEIWDDVYDSAMNKFVIK